MTHSEQFLSDNNAKQKEAMCMMCFCKMEDLRDLTVQFEAFLITDSKEHLVYTDWVKHMRNWLNTRPKPKQTKVAQTQNSIDQLKAKYAK